MKKAFEYLNQQYVDEQDKQTVAMQLNQEIRDLSYTYSLQGPGKYFEAMNNKLICLNQLGILKIDTDKDCIVIADFAFRKVVPTITVNKMATQWKNETIQD